LQANYLIYRNVRCTCVHIRFWPTLIVSNHRQTKQNEDHGTPLCIMLAMFLSYEEAHSVICNDEFGTQCHRYSLSHANMSLKHSVIGTQCHMQLWVSLVHVVKGTQCYMQLWVRYTLSYVHLPRQNALPRCHSYTVSCVIYVQHHISYGWPESYTYTIDRVWPYISWDPCQNKRIYTVYDRTFHETPAKNKRIYTVPFVCDHFGN